MRWEVTTDNKRHVIVANSGSEAVLRVKSVDVSEIKSVKILPKTTMGKIKSLWNKFTT
jgi:hypothetical protein